MTTFTPPCEVDMRSPLLRNLLLFARLLRGAGVPATPSHMIEVVNALQQIDLASRSQVQDTLRCLLINTSDQRRVFDDLFESFWRTWLETDTFSPGPPDRAERQRSGDALEAKSTSSEILRDGSTVRMAAMTSSKMPNSAGESGTGVHASLQGGLRDKDFAEFDAAELTQARRFLAEMRWPVTLRRSLRLRTVHGGHHLDVRRTVRSNMGYGGELLDLQFRGHKTKRRRVVLLCDVSGSMDRYTRLLLHFLHSVESGLQGAEVFVFARTLTRVTHSLRHRDPDTAVSGVRQQVEEWSGGTHIGHCLHTFNTQWARRVMGQGAIVLIISDGWDRGEPEVLGREMERLQRASYRLIWLNPLLGSPRYQPLTRGIQAALPYVDDFLPVHNLASLGALAALLNAMDRRRPSRNHSRRTTSVMVGEQT